MMLGISAKYVGLLVAIALAAGALVSVTAESAHAFALLSCRWQHSTITYANAAVGSTYQTLANDAANDWTNDTTNVYLELVPASTGPNIGIHTANFGNTNYDGITHYTCNGYDFSGEVDSYWNTYYTDGYQPWNYKLQVMVHELGHALGLDHAGTATCTGQPIMYYSSSRYTVCGHYSPQSDDINGANYVY